MTTRRDRYRHAQWKGVSPMSADEHVRHAAKCFGKLTYPTKAKAMRAKRNHARGYKVKYGVYKCPYCNKWHLTTHPW